MTPPEDPADYTEPTKEQWDQWEKEGKVADQAPEPSSPVTEQEESLKPCPFCGNPVRRGSDDSLDHINAFWCETCLVEFTILWQTKPKNYVELWNTRNGDSPLHRELTEAKRELIVVRELLESAKVKHAALVSNSDRRICQLKAELAACKPSGEINVPENATLFVRTGDTSDSPASGTWCTGDEGEFFKADGNDFAAAMQVYHRIDGPAVYSAEGRTEK